MKHTLPQEPPPVAMKQAHFQLFPLTHEYAYDVNGNMLQDYNKSLSILAYNYLNLPDSIDFGNNKRIEYLYNAVMGNPGNK